MSFALDRLNTRIRELDARIDEELDAARRSRMMGTLAGLQMERDAIFRDQSDLIAAVVRFARELRDVRQPRLNPRDGEYSPMDCQTRLQERERVSAELFDMLDSAGVDIYEENK